MKNYCAIHIILLCIVTRSLCRKTPPVYTYDMKSVSSEKCNDRSYQCNDGSCIPEAYRCNGMIDCETGEDEQDCRTCPLDFCPCADGLCIDIRGRCNGKTECDMDGEDEDDCVDKFYKQVWSFYNPKKRCIFWRRDVPGGLDCSNMELVSLPCVTQSITEMILNNNKLGWFNGLSNSSFMGNKYENLRVLEMEKNYIKSLPSKMIENKHWLSTLSLADNQITHLDEIAFPPTLEILNLQGNQIKKLPPKVFVNMTKLRDLSLARNLIEYLDDGIFTDLLGLNKLNLTKNSIQTLRPGMFSSLTEMRICDFSHNRIEIIANKTFHGLNKLRTLYLNSNNLTKLDGNTFESMELLNKLFLQHNQITVIDEHLFSGSKGLATLDLSHNKLTQLGLETFQGLVYLQKLILNDNHIIEIHDDAFSHLENLNDLFMSRNNIKKLFHFPRCTRHWLCTFMTMDISENEIEEIKIEAELIRKYRFKDVFLQGNKLKTLKSGWFNGTQIINLKLNNNQLGAIDDYAFNGLKIGYADSIFLNSNNMVKITSNMFKGIESRDSIRMKLFLNNNKITTIEDYSFEPFQSIGLLDLSSNALSEVKANMFQGIRELRNITLQNNEIENIERYSFNEIKDLIIINLSDNRLTELRSYMFESLPRLQELYLQNNKIKTIEATTFRNLTELLALDISDNMITELRSKMFEDLLNLETLSLQRNEIRNIETDTFKNLETLRTLDLSENEIIVLPANLMPDSGNLRHLYLQNNKIKIIDEFTFSGLILLSTLNLKSNEIGEVHANVFKDLRRLRGLIVDEFRLCCFQNVAKKCESPGDEFSSCEDLMKNSLLRSFVWIIGVMSIVANSIVIILRIKHHSINKHQATSFPITNLAMSNLLMGIYLLVIASTDTMYKGKYYLHDQYWRGSCWCDLAGFLFIFSSELTVLILTILAIDSLYAVSFPIRARQRRISRTKSMVMVAWPLAAIISLLPLPFFNIPHFKNFYGRSGVCLSLHLTNDTPTEWQYSVFLFIILNAILFVVITICNLSMYLITTIARRSVKSSNQSKDTMMASRMTFLLTANAACWVLIITLGIRSLMGLNLSAHVHPWIVVFLLPLNAALNPILYMISSLLNFQKLD